MNKDELLDQFTQSHPELMRLNPKVVVDKNEISVFHLFEFDNRLIEKEFKGVKVNNIIIGKHPSEFPSENAELPLEDWYAPERYLKYLDKNLARLGRILKVPELTKEEALDALTGDFKKHIDWCIGLRNKRIAEEKDNMAFLTELLYEIKQAYLLSDIYQKSEENKWYYAASATRLMKNKPLILGFNWGVDSKAIEKGFVPSPQAEYPFSHFSGLYDELGSFKKVVDNFHVYYQEGLTGVQTNYCFFRSPNESDISGKDIQLCEPIFDKLINYLKPSSILTFSKKLHRHLMNRENQVITESIPSGDKTVYVSKGKIIINKKSIDYYNLPHPNNWHYNKPESIEKAWIHCFGETTNK